MADHSPQIDLEAVKDDTAFRTRVLVHLEYIRKDIEEMNERLSDHIEKDETRFGKVEQKIGENSGSIAKGAGILTCLVALSAFILWLVDKAKS